MEPYHYLLNEITRVRGTRSNLHLWHFVLPWPVARPSDGPGGVQQAKSAKNYRCDRVPRTLEITVP